jgi:hypothetical protein
MTLKEFKILLSDSFAYKYEFIQRIKEIKEIQRLKWQIASKEHLTNEDLIRLKCLSSVEESTTLLCDIYDALSGIDRFIPPITTKTDDEVEEAYPSRTTFGRDLSRFGTSSIVHPDYRGRYPGDPGYNGNAKF